LEASCASVFRPEAPNLLDPLDQAILSHWYRWITLKCR